MIVISTTRPTLRGNGSFLAGGGVACAGDFGNVGLRVLVHGSGNAEQPEHAHRQRIGSRSMLDSTPIRSIYVPMPSEAATRLERQPHSTARRDSQPPFRLRAVTAATIVALRTPHMYTELPPTDQEGGGHPSGYTVELRNAAPATSGKANSSKWLQASVMRLTSMSCPLFSLTILISASRQISCARSSCRWCLGSGDLPADATRSP